MQIQQQSSPEGLYHKVSPGSVFTGVYLGGGKEKKELKKYLGLLSQLPREKKA